MESEKNNNCCKEYNNGDLSLLHIKKFDSVSGRLKKCAYTCDEDTLMFCSPVGNQIKYENKHKANIVITGFCTAPDAAINYLEDNNKDHNIECRHTFNTPNMKKGLKMLLDSIGFKDSTKCIEHNIDSDNYTIYPSIYFTQILCMISYKCSSKASDVSRVLKNNNKFLSQANSSLKSWYGRIEKCLREDGAIIIMGKDAINLLKNSWFLKNGDIKINYKNKQSGTSLSLIDKIKQKYEIFESYHASAFRYKKNKENWQKSANRIRIKKYLKEKFPEQIE